MTSRIAALCIDADDPPGLARFWAIALGWHADPAGTVLVPADGTPFPIRFVAGAARKSGPNRFHFDLTTTSAQDQADTVAALLDAGGRHIDIGQRPEEGHVVLADPEGNELCVLEPGNRFLGDCGRLGAFNGDGSPEVGRFWSEALGWPLFWDQDGETAIRPPAGGGPVLSWALPVPPKRSRNRFHLDLVAGDVDAEVARLVALGATRGDDHGADGVDMVDPDGNEFRVRAD